MKRAILCVAFAALCGAQTTVNGGRDYKGTLKASGNVSTVDFSGAGGTAPAKAGALASRPSACTQGQIYFAADVAAGQNLYFCTATGAPGVWTQMSGNAATAMTAGPGAATGNCAPPAIYIDTTNQDLWYCGAANSWKKPTADTSGFPTVAGTNTWTGSNTLSGGQLTASGGASAVDFRGAGSTAPAKAGTSASRPTACTQGQVYFSTDAAPGQNLYFCTTTGIPGVWTQMSGATTATITAGTGAPGGNCTPPVLYIDTTNQDLWFCGAANSWKRPTADTSGLATLAGANTWTGYSNLSGGQWRPPESTVANLPSAAGNVGKVFMVTDAVTAGSCSTGGGALRELCRAAGSAYECVGGCGSGGGTTAYISSLIAGPDSTRTIAGATHGFATSALLVAVYDSAAPRNAISAGWTVDPSTYDVVIAFASPQTNYYVVINGGTGPAGPTGPTVYPGAGVPNSTGSSWGTSYTAGTAANNLVQLNGSAQLPAVSAILLTNFPTLNQNTTGTAAGIAAGSSGQVPFQTGAGATGFSSGLTYNDTTKVLGLISGYTAGQSGTATGTYKINGTTSGVITITGASAAGTWSLTLPATGGTNNYALTTNGSGVTSWSQINLASAVTGNLPVTNLGSGTSASASTYWRGDGTWATPSGSGTVTVVGAGALTSTALVTGGGTTTLQTPSATATLDASGNISTPGALRTGVGTSAGGYIEFGQGTAPSAGTTAVTLYGHSAITSYTMRLPSAAGTGFIFGTNTAGDVVQTFVSTIPAGNGGTGVANTATLTLGSSNQNWATLGTGIVKNTATTGAITKAAAADVYGLWSGTCNSSSFLRGDGACASPSGSGTVTSSGTPLIHQIPLWTTATDIKGIAVGATDKPLVGVTGADPAFSKLTLTNPATAATLTIADNKSLTVNNIMTLAGTDTQTYTFPSTSATIARTDAANTFTGTQTFTAPVLGTPASVTLTNATGLPAAQVPATPVITPGTTPTLVGPRGYAICTGTCFVSVPVPVAGYEFCVMNDDNVSTAITLSALGSSAMYENSARTAYGTAGTGTLALSAAAANKVCIAGRDSTHYLTVSYNGAVTVN